MYLEGNALMVYLEIGEKDQVGAEKRLKTAVLEGAFEAYNKLRKVTKTGEPVDVFAAEIRELAGLVGYTRQNIKMAFVSGFPDHISMELQRLTGIKNMEV